jgi:ATP-dependent DNA ligase
MIYLLIYNIFKDFITHIIKIMSQQLLKPFEKLPQLYQKNATGKIYCWYINVREEGDNVFVETKHGQLDGVMMLSKKEIKSGKRIGTIGETSKIAQAYLVSKSKWKNKIKKGGYFETINNAENIVFISPMLAYTFDFKTLGKKRGVHIILPAISQPKLDGWRCLTHCEIHLNNSVLEMRTRNNTLYESKNYTHIIKDLETIDELKDGLYIDGELYTKDIPFEELGLLKKKKEINEKFKLIKYFVYDCFYVDKLDTPFIERYELLEKITKNMDNVILVKNKIVKNAEDIKKNFKTYIDAGYEGLMLRNINSPYEIDKRSKHLQKYKEFKEDEFEIIGFKEATGNDKGTIVWKCVTEDGHEFSVRPRGTREFRKKLFKNGKKYIGKYLTVIYFSMTKYGVPRMPVGKSVREDM